MGLGLALPLTLQHPLPDILRTVSFLPRKLRGPCSTGHSSFPGRQYQTWFCAFRISFGQGTAFAAAVGKPRTHDADISLKLQDSWNTVIPPGYSEGRSTHSVTLMLRPVPMPLQEANL